MKPIERKVLKNGYIQITVEKTSLFGLIKTKTIYTSNRVIVGNFRNWIKEPNKTLVPDWLSFQLDEWNNLFQVENKLK